MNIEEYLNQVSNLNFSICTKSIFRQIQIEGLDEENDAYNINQWEFAFLNIGNNDLLGLKNLESETIDKFNLFDIKLKELYNMKYYDLIEYEEGTICIVRFTQE
jgi:hypothetical protein